MFKQFIKASNEYCTKERYVPAPYIRRGFELDFVPTEAKITIATPGFYELYVNGKNITKGALAPYISNPDLMVCYDEYDVLPYLKEGKNAIGVILGNGFANQMISKWNFCDAPFRAPITVALNLTAKGNGAEFSLDADESFKTYPSHIIFDMYRYGTHCDARAAVDGWCEADFDDSKWKNVLLADAPKGDIIKCTAHPVTSRGELTPVSIEKQENFSYYKDAIVNGKDTPETMVESGYLYDFGINTSGVCRLKIKGKRGQKIILRHGESLVDGKFNVNSTYFTPASSPDYGDHIFLFQTDVYILRGGEEEIWIPEFTYHGFRYVFVEGITEEQATKDLLTYIVLSSDVKKRADFNCSDEILNKLYAMAINADLSNFHYFLTDCPHREKNGWTGDASVSAEQVFMTFDCADSLKLWLKSMQYSQCEDGMLPCIVPTATWGYTWGNGPTWDAASVNIPYAAYKYDGRLDVFEDSAKMIDKYLHYIAGRRDEKGLIACGLGDWCQPGKLIVPIKAPLELTDSGAIFDIATKSALMFEKLGLKKEAEYAKGLAEELRAAIRSELIDYETMSAAGNCQTSQCFLISLGIFTPEEYKKAYARLIEIIDENGRKLDTGVIGLRHIFEVLIKGGDAELALELIKNKEEPSYGAMLERGATALCEALEDGTVNASQNHHFFGDFIRVFTKCFAGIDVNPTLECANEIVFSPIVTGSLDFVNAEYKGVIGGWKRTDGKVVAYIDMPEDFHGSFVYGGESKKLSAGHNEFILN